MAVRERFSNPPSKPAPLIPSATVVLVRDGAEDLEVLLLRRGRQLNSFAGIWVFPGGAVEKGDGPGGNGSAFASTARHTAVRELREEAGLTMAPGELVALSRWTAPLVMPKRFDTWFFVALAPADEIRVDHGEIQDYRWAAPRAALQDHRAGRLPIFPPTWVTLHHLSAHRRCETAMAAAARQAPEHFAPWVVKQGPDTCFLYGGDVAYGDHRIDRPGPRHRLWVRGDDWQYERTAPVGP